jgi:hypothetical protein
MQWCHSVYHVTEPSVLVDFATTVRVQSHSTYCNVFIFRHIPLFFWAGIYLHVVLKPPTAMQDAKQRRADAARFRRASASKEGACTFHSVTVASLI